MHYTHDQFHPDEAWLIFRIDPLVLVSGKPADIYMMMDMGSAYIFGQIIVTDKLPLEIDIYRLMKNAFSHKNKWPGTIFYAANDPAEDMFRKFAGHKNIIFRNEPASAFTSMTDPVKKSFYHYQKTGGIDEPEYPDDEEASALSLIPDSYDPCWCASGKKFKFCCKPFFQEIINAMNYAEEGRFRDALLWMDKAEKKAGETPEILCRYAIVYSFFDNAKSDEYLEKCLAAFPGHPRANYIMGIKLKDAGIYEDALRYYMIAVNNYADSDRFHLNETWNNIGSVYYEMNDYVNAKAAWEKSLEYLPGDRMARQNLKEFIYDNPGVPDDIKRFPSVHLLNAKDSIN
jgi:hypothetical protein